MLTRIFQSCVVKPVRAYLAWRKQSAALWAAMTPEEKHAASMATVAGALSNGAYVGDPAIPSRRELMKRLPK